MVNSIIYSAEDCLIEYFGAKSEFADRVVFVFSSAGNRELTGNGYGGDFFLKNGCDVIAFKVNIDNWYQTIPISIFDKIADFLSVKKYSFKFSYGSSMGGFAAIVFSKLLQCDFSISFSPQFSIDESFDLRWVNSAKRLTFNYRINSSTVSSECKFFIFYDSKDIDSLHAEKIKELIRSDNLSLYKMPYSGHPCVTYMNEIGVLKRIALKLIKCEDISNVNLMSEKKTSKWYLSGLCQALLRRGKYKYALSVIDLALIIDNSEATLYRRRSDILHKMGRIDEAIFSINKAIELRSSESDLYHLLSVLYWKRKDFKLSIEASEKSISLNPDNQVLYYHLSQVQFDFNLLDAALASISKAISLDVTSGMYFRRQAEVLQKLGRRSEALMAIDSALKIDPTNLGHINFKNKIEVS